MHNQTQTENQTERQGYHKPIPALDSLCGYDGLNDFEQTQNRKADDQEKFFFFGVTLEISRSIPFIYDCIREQSPSWQALNAGIEAMIELHKAYNRHIEEQFSRFERDVLKGGEQC
ncbi:hypothetical protein ACWIUH_11765 [Ursidibacter arcticus]